MIVNSLSSSTTSWEEKAFAEDISNIHGNGMDGSHGGCVWPPRSYSCAFCFREFRSAQALGGHMNIHRRDRAKLKQCLVSDIIGNNNSTTNNTNDNSTLCPQSSTENIFDHQYQNSPLKPLVLDPNHCPNYSYSRVSTHIPSSSEYLSTGVVLDLDKKTNDPRELGDYGHYSNQVVLSNSSPIRVCDEIIIDNKASHNWERPELLFLLTSLQSAISSVHEVKPVASIEDLDLELRLGHAKVV